MVLRSFGSSKMWRWPAWKYISQGAQVSDKIRDGMDSPAQRSSENLSEVAGVETRGGQIFVFTPPRYTMGVWTEAVKFECSLSCLQCTEYGVAVPEDTITQLLLFGELTRLLAETRSQPFQSPSKLGDGGNHLPPYP